MTTTMMKKINPERATMNENNPYLQDHRTNAMKHIQNLEERIRSERKQITLSEDKIIEVEKEIIYLKEVLELLNK